MKYTLECLVFVLIALCANAQASVNQDSVEAYREIHADLGAGHQTKKPNN